jgi:hypothetical protein
VGRLQENVDRGPERDVPLERDLQLVGVRDLVPQLDDMARERLDFVVADNVPPGASTRLLVLLLALPKRSPRELQLLLIFGDFVLKAYVLGLPHLQILLVRPPVGSLVRELQTGALRGMVVADLLALPVARCLGLKEREVLGLLRRGKIVVQRVRGLGIGVQKRELGQGWQVGERGWRVRTNRTRAQLRRVHGVRLDGLQSVGGAANVLDGKLQSTVDRLPVGKRRVGEVVVETVLAQDLPFRETLLQEAGREILPLDAKSRRARRRGV